MDFSKQIQKAEEALRRRNPDFAVQLYQQLLELEPDLGEARAGLRRALAQRFEKKGAPKLLRALKGAAPLATAKALRKAGRHEACAKALESYLATSPLDEEANLLLGQALEDAGHFQSARAVYEFLTEIAPRNPEGQKRAGAMMYRAGDHARALEYYERALQADPRDQEALKARKDLAAETALTRGRYDEVGHSREQMAGAEAARDQERGQRRHRSEDDLRQELSELEDRLAETPSDPELLGRLAQVHEKLGDPEAALELLERALEYRRDDFELVCRAGDLRSRALKKRIAQAGKAGDEAEATRLERELQELEVADARRRVELHPTDAQLRLQLGRRLLRLDLLDEALPELQRAGVDPRVQREARFHLGRCFQRKGFSDLARTEYERALEGASDADDRAKEILYNLGAIAEADGDPTGARAFYARIYAVDVGYRDVAAKMESFR